MSATLPLIDVARLASSDPAERHATGRIIRAACLEHGFFHVTGHGIPQGLIDAAPAQTRALFDLAEAAKRAVDKSTSSCNHGYEGLGAPAALPARRGPPPGIWPKNTVFSDFPA